jgi:hypothetical protein
MRHTLSLVAAVMLCSAAASAQTTPAASGTPEQTLSINPFGMMLNWYNIEYERRISSSGTLGASVSANADWEYSNLELLARYYPQGEALRGFYLGGRAGAFGIEVTEYQFQPAPAPRNPSDRVIPPYPVYTRRKRVVPGLGLEVGYNWLLGREQRVSIGLGFGLSRLIYDRDPDWFYLQVVPHPRIVNVGIAF